MRWIIVCLGVALVGVCMLPDAAGQDGDEVLTNADILTLTEAGLPASVILAKIAATRSAFETSVDQLVALSQADVDAGVIEAMVAAGEMADRQAGVAAGQSVDFGDDTGPWARDGECDDPRFEGDGMATNLVDSDRGRDATDCRQLFESGRIRLPGVDGVGQSVDFGDDTGPWARDGECDDSRFEGDGMASTLIDSDRGRDATDCRQLYESGRIRLSGVDVNSGSTGTRQAPPGGGAPASSGTTTATGRPGTAPADGPGCEVPGYPTPANVQSLGLNWCGPSVDFQKRAFALQAAGAWCAIDGGSSSTPEQISARHQEINAACDALDELQARLGGRSCQCPAGYRP